MVVTVMKKNEAGGEGQCCKVYDGGQKRAPCKDDI